MGDDAWWRDFRPLLEQLLDEKLQKVLDKLEANLAFGRESIRGSDVLLSERPVDEQSQAADRESADGEFQTTTSCLEAVAENEQLKDYMQVKDIEEHYEGLYEVTRAFNLLCQQDRCTISALELVEMRQRHHQQRQKRYPDAREARERQERFTSAILMVNSQLAILEGRKSLARGSRRATSRPLDEISLDTFTLIMHQKKDLEELPPDREADLNEIREVLLKEETYRKVAQCTNTDVKEIQAFGLRRSVTTRCQQGLLYLDPFIGAVILLNAVVIVVSVDFERGSDVWAWFELCFAAVFLGELLLRISASGLLEFVLGQDMAWNLFDTAVVFASSLSLLLSRVNNRSASGDLMLMRLLRFARLTKLVRVLKLKIFTDLVMLVNGILVGFRTLLWVVVFMLFLLIFLGVFLTDALGHGTEEFSACPRTGPGSGACLASAEHLREHNMELFGNLFRSMFTVFRCLTDDCSSLDGTPLVPYFLFTMGPPIVVIYMLVFIFVTFGLFNLIMAVFVENTLDGAKRLEIKRKEARRTEHIRLARKLQQLIVMFCHGDAALGDEVGRRDSLGDMVQRRLTKLKDYFSTRIGGGNSFSLSDNGEAIQDLHVTQDVFCEVCGRPEVQSLLADLDIEVESRRTLFEIIDANSNGTLEVTELVEGLLRLRGCSDRTEAIESLLAIKAMQRSLKAVEVLGLHQQELVKRLVVSQGQRTPCAGQVQRFTSALAFAQTASVATPPPTGNTMPL